jgi:hemerythrin-like domain-containing protein
MCDEPADIALRYKQAVRDSFAFDFVHVCADVENVLADREVLRQTVDTIVRDFITHERRHMMMEDRDFFPAALKALKPQDWTEIASAVTGHKDPLFSDVTEERFDALRAHILRLEQEAEAERK